MPPLETLALYASRLHRLHGSKRDAIIDANEPTFTKITAKWEAR